MDDIAEFDPALFSDVGWSDLQARMTPAEEQYLAHIIEAGVLAHEAPPDYLSAQERRILVLRGELARHRFLAANLGLVGWVVTREWRDPEPEELFQEGVLGLDRAVRGYDYRRGGFAAYALHWIRQAIMIARAHRMERSVRWYRDWRKARGVEDTLSQTLQREVSWHDVAAELDQPWGWVRDRLTPPPTAVEPEILLQLGEAVVPDPEPGLSPASIDALLEGLDQLPRRVVQLRYGLGGHREHTRKAAAAQLGLSEKQVVRIEAEALEDLRGLCPHQMSEYLAA